MENNETVTNLDGEEISIPQAKAKMRKLALITSIVMTLFVLLLTLMPSSSELFKPTVFQALVNMGLAFAFSYAITAIIVCRFVFKLPFEDRHSFQSEHTSSDDNSTTHYFGTSDMRSINSSSYPHNNF